MGKDSVLIYSGGLDSTTLLYDRCDRIALALTFDYGSVHNRREIECARWNCEKLGIEHIVISFDFMSRYFKSSLLENAEAIPDGHYEDSNMMSTVVPFRNGIMLSIACGMAESRGLSHVMMANHGGDHAIYPDCRRAFVDAMSEAMKAGTYNGVSIIAPYTDISKADIVAIGKKAGVDFFHTYSCYKGGEEHCGKCGTCVERKEAMRMAGVDDPTVYTV